MKKELQKKLENLKSNYITFVEGVSAPRSHPKPIHITEARLIPTSAKFQDCLEIKKDMDFDSMDESLQFFAHGLLHFLHHRVKKGRKIIGDLSKEDLRNLHQKLVNKGDIPHTNFDELDKK